MAEVCLVRILLDGADPEVGSQHFSIDVSTPFKYGKKNNWPSKWSLAQ
jgi:hypothetical protein